MLWVILIINILTFLGVAGNSSTLSKIQEQLKPKPEGLPELEPKFVETPIPKNQRRRKQAVKKTTTLRKRKQ